jgi:DNA polymerase-3 subunit beta
MAILPKPFTPPRPVTAAVPPVAPASPPEIEAPPTVPKKKESRSRAEAMGQGTSLPQGSPETQAVLSVKVKQEDLAKALGLVKVGVLENSTMPILKNILMATDRGRLRLSATSLEIGVQVWIDAEIFAQGLTVVPADSFRRVVATLQPGEVTLVVPPGSLTLTVAGPGSKTNIRSGADPQEFPTIPTIDAAQPTAVIDARLLKAMIGQVEFAADTDLANKAVWASVKVDIGTDMLTLAAADTFRVAERIAPLPAEVRGGGLDGKDVLVPAKNMASLANILPVQGKVTIMVTPQHNQIVFALSQGEEIEFVSRLISGKYPPYKRTFPKEYATRVVVDTKMIMNAVDRAAIFALGEKKSVRMTFKGADESGSLFGAIVVDADAETGDSVSTVSAEVTGPPQELFFHVVYLRSVLEHMETPQLAMEIRETGKPVLIKPIGDIQYTTLVQTQFMEKTEA